MADGVRIANWDTASHILAVACNWRRKKGTAPIRPDQLHPYRRNAPKSFRQSLLALKPLLKKNPAKDQST